MNSVQIRKISNGYVVTTYSGATPAGPSETYCADLASVYLLLDATFEPTVAP